MDLNRFRNLPLMGILRGGDVSIVGDLVATLVRAGLETLEITLNTREAPAMIRRAREVAGDALMIGAGTVLDRSGVAAALDAGAGFIVSPVLVPEVVAECRNRGIDVAQVLTRCLASIVLASRSDEVKSFPTSLMESLASGRPVLVSRVIPISFYIEENDLGKVIESLSIEELVRVIRELMDQYPFFRRAVDSRKQSDLSAQRMVVDYASLYRKVIE